MKKTKKTTIIIIVKLFIYENLKINFQLIAKKNNYNCECALSFFFCFVWFDVAFSFLFNLCRVKKLNNFFFLVFINDNALEIVMNLMK